LSQWVPYKIYEIPTGTRAFDWTVPREWNITDAYIEDSRGKKVVDFKDSNLHVMGYSVPVDKWIDLNELQEHLISLEDQPDAIPYSTSYYHEDWGFCMTHSQREGLLPGRYHVVINSTLKDGHLTFAELLIPGISQKEIFISSYICHPSMANNELSGPVVTTFLGRWLMSKKNYYTYRLFLGPETIGALVYLSRNLKELKKNVEAGFVLTCIGDNDDYSYIASRYGNNLADKTARHVLKHSGHDYTEYSYLQRGADERQYSSPGVDLPMATLCRTKFGKFPQYHTSLDNLEYVTPEGLAGGFEFIKRCILTLEANRYYVVTCKGEPQFGRRGLYRKRNEKAPNVQGRVFRNICSYADGTNDLIDISNIIEMPAFEVAKAVQILVENGILKEMD
jgi:aminopeptidase-like protein